MTRKLAMLAVVSCNVLCTAVHADPITTGIPSVFRDHEGPNTIGSGVGDNLTIVVRDVRPNLSTTAYATNVQIAGTVPLQNLFTATAGFIGRSFANDAFGAGGTVVQPWTVTLQNRTDAVSVATNGLVGVQQLPLLGNLVIGGSPLAPTLSWDPVTTSVPFDQVRLSIYNDRNDQLIVQERLLPGGPTTTSYTVPLGTLAPNADYAFRVFLWDSQEAGGILNRSSTHVNFTTASAAVGAGNLLVTTYVNPNLVAVPLVLSPGANNHPDSAIGIGVGGPGAASLKSGTTLAGSFLNVGNNAYGTLLVDSTTVVLNGSAALNPVNPAGDGGFLTVGRVNGGRGFADVTNGGRIDIRSNELVNPGMNIGREPGAFGAVHVDGPGSTIVVTGLTTPSTTPPDNGVINVGRGGDGRLNILGGAQVVNAPAGVTNVGRDPSSRGSLLVSGTGSMLDAGCALNVGVGGEGSLRIENGGRVVACATTLGPGGILTGDQGTLQTVLNVSGGVFAPGSSPGKMTIEGDMAVTGGRLLLEAFGPSQVDAIDVTGQIAIGANAGVEILLGYIPAGPLTFLTAGNSLTVDPGFAGPVVIGLLGTEAQGIAGATVAIKIGDATYDVPVQVPDLQPGVDYDGDGTADDADDCPGSSAAPVLMIGGCDTGAANASLGRGCKLSDSVRSCEIGTRNHGGFVSCVARNANAWLRAGLVGPSERGAIQACAARTK